MTEKRTILLLGRTGNGKSTIANVISNTNNFAESEYGVSETRGIQEGRFKVRNEDIEFHIVDTIGIGDTRFDERQVLIKLAEAANAIKNGLNQILFVTSGRFTEEEVKAYTLLRTVFFAEDIGEYTTIIRTKFPSFRRAEKCREDKERMIAENEDVADIIRSCKKLIHVNNLTEEEDPFLRARAECRNILRTHLKLNCGVVYRPKNLDEANARARSHMSDRERTQRQMNGLEEKLRQSEERAKNADEAARKREEKMQQEYKNDLRKLANQQATREDKIAKLMADQMNSKLSEIKEGYSTVVSQLQSSINRLSSQLSSERTQYNKDMKAKDNFYSSHINNLEKKWDSDRQFYQSYMEEASKRPTEVYFCKIM